MQRKKRVFIIILLLVIIGATAYDFVFFEKSDQDEGMVVIGTRQWTVEKVSSPALRELGLGLRESLPSGRGMLFLFPDIGPGEYAFWMKGMRFSLDIAWMRDGRVIFLEHDVPSDSQDIFRPLAEADSVLEVNAGEFRDVALGDVVRVE